MRVLKSAKGEFIDCVLMLYVRMLPRAMCGHCSLLNTIRLSHFLYTACTWSTILHRWLEHWRGCWRCVSFRSDYTAASGCPVSVPRFLAFCTPTRCAGAISSANGGRAVCIFHSGVSGLAYEGGGGWEREDGTWIVRVYLHSCCAAQPEHCTGLNSTEGGCYWSFQLIV